VDIEDDAVGENVVVVVVDNLGNFVVDNAVLVGEDEREEGHSRQDNQNQVVVHGPGEDNFDLHNHREGRRDKAALGVGHHNQEEALEAHQVEVVRSAQTEDVFIMYSICTTLNECVL